MSIEKQYLQPNSRNIRSLSFAQYTWILVGYGGALLIAIALAVFNTTLLTRIHLQGREHVCEHYPGWVHGFNGFCIQAIVQAVKIPLEYVYDRYGLWSEDPTAIEKLGPAMTGVLVAAGVAAVWGMDPIGCFGGSM